MCLDVPSLLAHSLVHLEKLLGTALEDLVTTELLSTGKEELECAKMYTISDLRTYRHAVVDGGWSKRNHKHS